jgi:hypothetical protein
VHTVSGHHGAYPMSQTDHYGSYLNSAQSTDKPHELAPDGDVLEGRDENKIEWV